MSYVTSGNTATTNAVVNSCVNVDDLVTTVDGHSPAEDIAVAFDTVDGHSPAEDIVVAFGIVDGHSPAEDIVIVVTGGTVVGHSIAALAEFDRKVQLALEKLNIAEMALSNARAGGESAIAIGRLCMEQLQRRQTLFQLYENDIVPLPEETSVASRLPFRSSSKTPFLDSSIC